MSRRNSIVHLFRYSYDRVVRVVEFRDNRQGRKVDVEKAEKQFRLTWRRMVSFFPRKMVDNGRNGLVGVVGAASLNTTESSVAKRIWLYRLSEYPPLIPDERSRSTYNATRRTRSRRRFPFEKLLFRMDECSVVIITFLRAFNYNRRRPVARGNARKRKSTNSPREAHERDAVWKNRSEFENRVDWESVERVDCV